MNSGRSSNEKIANLKIEPNSRNSHAQVGQIKKRAVYRGWKEGHVYTCGSELVAGSSFMNYSRPIEGRRGRRFTTGGHQGVHEPDSRTKQIHELDATGNCQNN